ncbi:MAG: leucyl aminopeptidase [Chitinophagales bacterium]|nr:leucyl aminopeptidase [Bacteroidota bacterium]
MSSSLLFTSKQIPEQTTCIYLIDQSSDGFSEQKIAVDEQERIYIHQQIEKNIKLIPFVRQNVLHAIAVTETEEQAYLQHEKTRQLGAKFSHWANQNKISSLCIVNLTQDTENTLLFAEGCALANYQFRKYWGKQKLKSGQNALEKIYLVDANEQKTGELNHLINAVYTARTLVNEPLSYLTAAQLADEVEILGQKKGFAVQVLKKNKIEQLGMGGLLAVNRGSQDPPRFIVMEHKPAKAKNTKPIVLVGKGIVFDTGGLSLKPTPDGMDMMKCDMAGAAAVIGILCAAADNKLPLHIIGLVPSTDNRPGENAYVPSDVIEIMDGTTVEVLNTDAEGRLVLADALCFAKRYNPTLVIDFATLTGAAIRAVGYHATALMSTADRNTTQQLINAGFDTYERLIEFPLWDEYGDMIKSDIADMKNIGGPLAGQITAGKFLQHFTDYPWMHLDIAPTAYLPETMHYRSKFGTGTGIRSVYQFLQHFSN